MSVSRVAAPTAFRAGDVFPCRMAVERIAGLIEAHIIWQPHGQIRGGDRHDAVGRAMDDGNWAAPIALARHPPVPELVVDLPLGLRLPADRDLLEPARNLFLGLLDRHAVEKARIDHHPIAVIGLRVDGEARRVEFGRAHHRGHAQSIGADKIKVALIVRGAAEDRARAIFHEHEIGDIDRQPPGGVERVQHFEAGVVALLLRSLDRGDRRADLARLLDERMKRRVMVSRRGGQRMVRRDRHEFRAKQRVRTGRVDVELACLRLALQRAKRRRIDDEPDRKALRAPDPVLLHQADFFRPPLEMVEACQQIVGIVGDLEEPLGELALLDRRARAPAAPVDHLLVGEHRLVDRVPIDLRLLARDQACGKEIEEKLLLVLVVARIAGRDLARPVERQPHRLQLRPHGGDIGVGPFRRTGVVLHGGVLRRQSERVPAHRMEDIEPAGAAITRHHIAHGVVAHMAHVDAPRRIGEHLEHVIFRARIVVLGFEDLRTRPGLAPFGLGFAHVVSFGPHYRGVL